jgi:3-isopropylmalate/(R)-2-methylmalate dehydratase small subunit
LPDGALWSFEIDPFRRDCLLKGLDDIGITLQRAEAIRAFEGQHRERFPWLFEDIVL